MNVKAVCKSTGKTSNVTITNESGRLSKDDIERLVKEAETFKEQDD
jgi:heat shock protein 1/8